VRKDGVKGFLKLAVQRILKDCVIASMWVACVRVLLTVNAC
jgi:hypothetical protein